MKITVKYFGIIADITQKKEELFSIDLHQNSLKSVKSIIEIKYPKLLDINYSIAVNEKFAKEDAEIADNDILAFLPPFAGG